ncbi:MAG: CoA transferase [Dehalococcoidia bacterium]|nr:CoA transferase [Dehalococcoidia bacterium]
MKALDGVRVLDLTRALAGPYCTMMLGDYGADVVKIELPEVGDDTRRWAPPFIGDQSAYFLSINRNKRSMTLNLRHEQGKEIFMKKAKDADVIVENFTPGVVDRLGIDYESVKAANHRIVYCSISGFGQTGPYKSKSAYDQTMQGLGGIMSLTGEPGRPPVKMGIALTDIGSGMMGAFAIMTTLFHRKNQNMEEGQYIDISMLDLQVAWLTYMGGSYFATGKNPEKVGAAHPTQVPYQAFMCQDGKYINIAVGSERLWERFCKAIDRADLFEHPDYAQNINRVENRSKLVPLLQEEFLKKPVPDWVRQLEEGGVPCGPINELSDVFADPQVLFRNMLMEIPHPTLGKIKQAGIPIKFSKTEGSIDRHPPLLGEHTGEVLLSLGYSEDAIASLKEEGVI